MSKLNRRGVLGLAAAALAVAAGGTAFAATAGPGRPAAVVTGYSASIGRDALAVSSLGTGSGAAVNAAGTLSLTVGSPSGSTYAQALLSLPAGSVLPRFAPALTTDNYVSGSPRWVIELANGDTLFGYPDQAPAGVAGLWEVSGPVRDVPATPMYAAYAAAVADAGGFGQVVKSAFIVADGDQAAGTTDTVSHVSYDGLRMTVRPVYAPVPRLSHGQGAYWAPTREYVHYTVTDAAAAVAAGDRFMFTIVGPGFTGQHGFVPVAGGVNTAAYEGLTPGHGYTVYYTLVGPDSTVPVAGSVRAHVWEGSGSQREDLPYEGYVYFVSNVPAA